MPAQIIAFPCRAAPPASIAPWPMPPRPLPRADAGQDRLRLALTKLDAALAYQRHVVADWRQSLAALQASVGTLEASMQRYRNQLDGIQTGVTGLNTQARILERRADGARLGADRAS
jgi:hypothetical protein